MALRTVVQNFTKGIISPELESRFDLPAYQAGLRRATNVKIRRTGGVTKRMGTRFVSEALNNPARLFPFQFSDQQAYALEFGQATTRPLALGGSILEQELQVFSITNAASAQVTAHYHGYSVGDKVYFTGIEGMVEINDRELVVQSVIDDHNFTVGFDSRMSGVFSGSGGGTDRTSAPTPPPPPPSVPDPLPAPEPPTVGSGSGGSYTSGGLWGGPGRGDAP
jgi:hypothetical protein